MSATDPADYPKASNLRTAAVGVGLFLFVSVIAALAALVVAALVLGYVAVEVAR